MLLWYINKSLSISLASYMDFMPSFYERSSYHSPLSYSYNSYDKFPMHEDGLNWYSRHGSHYGMGNSFDSHALRSYYSNRALRDFDGFDHDMFGHGSSERGMQKHFANSFAASKLGAFASGQALGSIVASGGRISMHETGSSASWGEGDGSNGSVAKNCSHSGDSGINFKFTNLSREANLADYNKVFADSKVFTFTATQSGVFNIIMISLTKDYYPQMRLCKMNKGNGEKYQEQKGENSANGNYASKFKCEKGQDYALEIGCNKNIDMSPFKTVNTGGFACVISQEKKCLQEIMSKEKCKVSANGKTSEIPIENGGDLAGSGSTSGNSSSSGGSASGSGGSSSSSSASGSGGSSSGGSASNSGGSSSSGAAGGGCGALDYSVTPYFDESKGSCTFFFHYSSSSSSSSYSQSSGSFTSESYAASAVEYKCNQSASSDTVTPGNEITKNFFEFVVPSKCACEVSDSLK